MPVIKLMLLGVAALVAATVVQGEEAATKPVMLLLTSHGQMGDLDRETGYYVPEAAHPAKVFANTGIHFEFVSVQGGRPPHDGLDLNDPVVKDFWESETIQELLGETKKVADVNPADYSAVLVVGGHGTMWDLPDNPDVQNLLTSVYEAGGVVAAVCHGPVALVNVKLSGGNYLVAGKRVAAFTNEEEEAMELSETVPFLLESRLVERGAVMQKAPNFESSVVTDERLVTGQNPASAEGVAKEVAQLVLGG